MSRLGALGDTTRAGDRWQAVAGSPLLHLAVRTGTLLVAYLLLERWVMGVARLPEASYHEPVIAAGLLEHLLPSLPLSPGALLRVGLPVLLVALAARRFGRVRAGWSELDGGSVLRPLVLVPAIVLAWALGTYAYNFYFDQAHLLDRLALVALVGLVAWRPAFVLPFTALAVSVLWQFNHPIQGFSVAEPFLLVRWLLLFFTFFALRAAGTGHRASDFVFLAFTLIAASYFTAGLGKLRLDWFSRGDVAFLLPATFAHGWLGFLDAEAVAALTDRLSRVDGLMVLGVFVVECGALLSLTRRRIFLFFLLAWPAFHLSVFALTGIFFWKWMVLESAVLVLLWARRRAPPFQVFSPRHAVLSVPLVLGGTLWFAPVDLSWYNAAVSYAYRFEGVGVTGCTRPLHPRFFAPYDYQFTMGAFAYLSPHRQLGVVWGATSDAALAEAMLGIRGPEDVETLERTRGRRFLEPTRAAAMDRFLQRFVGARNRRDPPRWNHAALSAPPHLWTTPSGNGFGREEPIIRVRVSRVTSVYTRGRYHELGPVHLREVAIPGAAQGTPGESDPPARRCASSARVSPPP